MIEAIRILNNFVTVLYMPILGALLIHCYLKLMKLYAIEETYASIKEIGAHLSTVSFEYDQQMRKKQTTRFEKRAVVLARLLTVGAVYIVIFVIIPFFY